MSFLPLLDVEYLNNKGVTFEEILEGGQKALILKSFALPLNKFDIDIVDVLVVIPQGFPDVGTDMFYLHPWAKLKDTNQYAKAADQAFVLVGITWQRWSRHSNDWRPGRDGIRTVLMRIQHALEVAA